MKNLLKTNPVILIGALITLVQGLAIPGAGKVIAILTFIGALITRQTVWSPASHEAAVEVALNTPVPTEAGAGGA